MQGVLAVGTNAVNQTLVDHGVKVAKYVIWNMGGNLQRSSALAPRACLLHHATALLGDGQDLKLFLHATNAWNLDNLFWTEVEYELSYLVIRENVVFHIQHSLKIVCQLCQAPINDAICCRILASSHEVLVSNMPFCI